MPSSPFDSFIAARSLVDGSSLAGEPVVPSSPAVEQDILVLFDCYASPLLRYVASFGLTPQESEDVVQDTFVALFQHLSLGRPRSNLRAWLFQVAHNLALRHRRTARRKHAGDRSLYTAADPGPDPETQLAERQRRRRLRAAAEALPERERRCLLLRAQGLRYREIARTLGVSLGAVAKSLSRAMTRLMNADGR